MSDASKLDLHALANAPMSETAKALAPFPATTVGCCPWCNEPKELSHEGQDGDSIDGALIAICYDCWAEGDYS
ncbi:MAG: hypothetical protein ACOYLS_01335 [Polymorphobacter sp.]